MKALCETATILRHGKVVAHSDPRETTAREMAELMVGDEIAWVERENAGQVGDETTPKLEISGLSLPPETEFGVGLKDISLKVNAGEIVGIAGIAGEGQTELMQAVIGERLAKKSESIRIDGDAVGLTGPTLRRQAGAAFVPEERNGHAAVSELALTENVVLTPSLRWHGCTGRMDKFRKRL